MNIREHKIILASASPRRRELLKLADLEFTVQPSTGEEVIKETLPDKVVMQLSKDKAMEIAAVSEYGTVIIGADTVVAAGDKILGKPKDREDAFRMISGLRNQSHRVYTGVTLVYHGAQGDVISNFACETKVYVYDMTDEEIWSYIETGEPMDKAGAYGIQGRFAEYVSHIEGDYNNVVGLPLSALLQEAKKMEV
jgi:septum formation protein